VAKYNFPNDPAVNDTFSPVGGAIWRWNGEVWLQAAPNAASSIALIGDLAPASPVPGQFWWESDTGKLFVWYDDGNSAQWVEAVAGSSNAGFVTPQMFGAVGDGVTDDTAAVQAAAASGEDIYVPPGRYLIKDMITIQAGVCWTGADKSRSVFEVPSSFNLSAQGVFKLSYYADPVVSTDDQRAPAFRHLGIDFEQPDTAVRANLIAYPPAIYARDIGRFTVEDVRIQRAKTGIDMTRNSGGVRILDLDISSFDFDIKIDGAQDENRITGMQSWLFGMTANQQTIARDATACGIQSGRCDGLMITNAMFFGKRRAVELITGIIVDLPGTTWGSLIGCDFDAGTQVNMIVGSLSVIGCRFAREASAPTPAKWITATDGRINIVGCHFLAQSAFAANGIDLGGGTLLWATVQGNTFNTAQHDFVHIGVGANSRYAISNNVFDKGGGITWTAPGIINVHTVTGSRGSISGNVISDRSGGSGNFINVAANGALSINDNFFATWGLGLPSGFTFAVGDNASVTPNNGLVQGHMVNRAMVARFTGNLTAGAATITHGISNLNTRVFNIQAFYISGTDRIPMTVGTLTATTLAISAGSGTAIYEVFVTYTNV
jgi:hypothetical protein